jgi:hypothetical protein
MKLQVFRKNMLLPGHRLIETPVLASRCPIGSRFQLDLFWLRETYGSWQAIRETFLNRNRHLGHRD